MMGQVAALQALVIGALLVWSSYGKLVGPLVGARARRTALKKFVGEKRAEPAFRAVGGVELLIGAALLLPPLWMMESLAAIALSVGFLGYLTYSRVASPDSSCGCAGSATAPVTWRTFGRAGLLLAAAVLASTADVGWWSAPGGAAIAVVLVEVMLFVALSSELDRHWLLPLRRLKVRLTHPLAATAAYDVPLATTQHQLLRSGAYRAVNSLLRSDIRDHWDEGEWRFVSYTATYDDRPATAVFAVPRLRYEPDEIRVAIVDDENGETVYRPSLLPVLA
ncbi:MauE/DoxX family redox-associated membrane protein [Kribbella catacumbae]|uniref:MauE/DoxX family redox-associated membrane protein n=1 Tax=Kribbella catacumbae TaxID=460086 RepID=UPI000382A55D|nr:MauE/DoxX family redox-associated membrane protein [Kribbella catacumbae]